jgi:hypothetical protein
MVLLQVILLSVFWDQHCHFRNLPVIPLLINQVYSNVLVNLANPVFMQHLGLITKMMNNNLLIKDIGAKLQTFKISEKMNQKKDGNKTIMMTFDFILKNLFCT